MEAVISGKFDSFDELRAGKPATGKAEVWRRRIEEQRASGQSVRFWCQGNNAREHSFYWWRTRLGLSPRKRRVGRPIGASVPENVEPPVASRVEPANAAAPLAFAQVVVDPLRSCNAERSVASGVEPPMASGIEPLRLRLAGGRELILPGSMPLEQVAKLVRVLEATA
jgi:hypothetical protein